MPIAKKLPLAAVAALSMIVSAALCAEPEAPAKAPPKSLTEPLPKTLGGQVTYLEGALAESLQTRDFEMLELAVKGFAAIKLPEKDLEMSILRSERDAAWVSGQQFGAVIVPSASMEAWGLMARVKLGNEQALLTLRKMAGDLPQTPEPLPAANTIPAAEYQARQKALAAFGIKFRQRGHALLALALLGEPGVQIRALTAIQNKTSAEQQTMMGFYGATDPLILAVLQSDTESGFQKLLAHCSDVKYALKDQTVLLGELNNLISNATYQGADDKFSIISGIRRRLPKDAQSKLVAPFISILKRYTPDPKQPWDMTLNTISNIGMMLPENALTADGVDAMDVLLNKLPGPIEQYPKQTFVAILKKNGKDLTAPVKPPRPTAEDKQF